MFVEVGLRGFDAPETKLGGFIGIDRSDLAIGLCPYRELIVLTLNTTVLALGAQ